MYWLVIIIMELAQRLNNNVDDDANDNCISCG